MSAPRLPFPPLRDLAVIGDRRTAAVICSDGTVCWYCPGRFDGASLISALLDPQKGAWRVDLPCSHPLGRRYVGGSAVLETRLGDRHGHIKITDFLACGTEVHNGLFCRRLAAPPADTKISLEPWCDYGRQRANLGLSDGAVKIGDSLYLFASHRLTIDDGGAHWILPKGEEGWTVLAGGLSALPQRDDLDRWQRATIDRWRELASSTTYRGRYMAQVEASLRMLRLLAFEDTGALVAAITAGIPEVIGGRRNYDYRFTWLRDTGMIMRALEHMERPGRFERHFLDFVATGRQHSRRRPLDVVLKVDGRPVPEEQNPPLIGYRASNPVRIGNRAGKQLQLGALGNLLLAVSAIYRRHQTRWHWGTIAAVGDFLASHWHEPDSGMWESPQPRQYTSSKVFAAVGLEALAPLAEADRAARYREAGEAIRRYVLTRCRTIDGAFAAFEGGQGVDVSAALFPAWSFVEPDAPPMLATIHRLERDYRRGVLYRREDETPEADREGAFLAGTFWMAQYWTRRGDLERARQLLEGGMACANDVGLLPEEIDPETGEMLGNLPLGMAHASFLSAVVDYDHAARAFDLG